MKSMRRLFGFVLLCVIPVGFSLGQDRPKVANLIELIARPEKYDKKVVTVRGFLAFSHARHDLNATFLYLYEEDAKNLLDSNIVVVPSKQMLQDEEKIDREYVILTGLFHAVPVAGNDPETTQVLDNIQSCVLWSDPRRPIGEQGEANRNASR